jgi:LacI family transcriptional regulator
MTILELAKKAQVSIATVSRALNPHTRHKVKAKTLEKIEDLMRKHSYSPNLAAKNLRRTTFQVIGILVPHLRGVFMGDYYPKLLSGVSDALLDSSYHFKMVMLKSENKKWDHYNFKFSEGVDGLIISHWPVFFSDKSVLNRLGIPCAVINDPEVSVQAYFVSCDNEEGGRLAAEHFYRQGHRKIAVLTGPEWSGDSILRLKGFQCFL